MSTEGGGGAIAKIGADFVLGGRKPTLPAVASAAAVGCGVGVLTLTGGIAAGLAAAGAAASIDGAAVAADASAAADGLIISAKIGRQMGQRGWTPDMIREAVSSGESFDAVNFATGAAAKRYVHPETGQSVIVDIATNAVIHVGAKGFLY